MANVILFISANFGDNHFQNMISNVIKKRWLSFDRHWFYPFWRLQVNSIANKWIIFILFNWLFWGIWFCKLYSELFDRYIGTRKVHDDFIVFHSFSQYASMNLDSEWNKLYKRCYKYLKLIAVDNNKIKLFSLLSWRFTNNFITYHLQTVQLFMYSCC